MMSRVPRPTEPHDLETTAGRVSAVEERARAHWRVAMGILAVNCGLYFVLILLIAYNKPFVARMLWPGLSFGIVFGSVVTVAAWLLTLLYVRWANTHDHAPHGD